MNVVFFKYKIKASALQLTIFIIVLIALLLFSFILFVSLQNSFKSKNVVITNTIDKAVNGINYSLGNNLVALDSVFNLDQNLKFYKQYWGIFENVTVKSFLKNQSFTKVALIGAKKTSSKVGLWLKDNNRALVLAGNSTIQGTTFLPEQGVKPGIIGGRPYTKSKLIFGDIKRSSKKFPEFLTGISNNINSIQNNITEKTIIKTSVDTLKNSFLNPVKTIFNESEIFLTNVTLSGHIVIKSLKKITVDASSNLNDVILIAPIVTIKNNVVGSFQAFANKQINVGKNVVLHYPSALVIKELQSDDNNKLVVKEGSIVKGVIMYLGLPNLNSYIPQVIIENKATVFGEVFCSSNTELIGTVKGSLYTNNFITKQNGTIYLNHLFNGEILESKLHREYAGILFKKSKKKVLKWLY